MPEEAMAEGELDRLWNDLVTGRLDADGYALEASVAEIVRAFQTMAAAAPGQASRDRVERNVLGAIARIAEEPGAEGIVEQTMTMPIMSSPFAVNGSRGYVPLEKRAAWHRRGWRQGALAQLATVALVALTLTAGYLTFGPGRRAQPEEVPAFMPAVVATPATPDAAAAPVAELEWQTKGDPNTPLDHPTGLAIDLAGHLWVTDSHHHQFQILSPEGAPLEVWGEPGSNPGQFNFVPSGQGITGSGAVRAAGGIAFAPDGTFYVADTGNHRVQKFGPDRQFLLAWGSEGRGEGQFLWPSDVAVDAQNQVYVADNGRSDVQVFDADGHYLRTIGKYGFGDGQFYLNRGGFVEIDGEGNVWVSDVNNGRIQQFSPDGEFLTKIGGPGTGPGRFGSPGQVAVDKAGRVFVTDWGSGNVQVFAPDGTFLASWGKEELGPIYSPPGLALDGLGNVYISDIDEDRILKFHLLPPLAP